MKYELSKKNLPVYVELEKAFDKQRFGTSTLTFLLHEGRVVSVIGNQFERCRFKDSPNTSAVEAMLAEIKRLHEDNQSGTFSFSIKMNEGEAKELRIQRNLKRSFQLDEKAK